ncbi:MAG: hypothetical protein K0U52_04580 [Gammaproteobacteria bacterium]|nr:hypothetical protein [Gammaproteobacteria bacterium]
MASFVAAGVLSTVAGVAIGRKKIKDKQQREWESTMSTMSKAHPPLPPRPILPPPARHRRRRRRHQSEDSMIQSVLNQGNPQFYPPLHSTTGPNSNINPTTHQSNKPQQTPFYPFAPGHPTCDLCHCIDCLHGAANWCMEEDCGKCVCKNCIAKGCECACITHGQSIVE